MATAPNPVTTRYPSAPVGPPDRATQAALLKPVNQLTPQEVQLIAQRKQIEEQARAAGMPVQGGILQVLLDREKGAQQGKRDGMAGVAYAETLGATMAASGYAADGTKLPAQGKAAVNPQYQSPAAAQNGAPAAAPAAAGGGYESPMQRGYALRNMPDGTFRGATMGTPDARGIARPEKRNFTTREEALGFYGAGPAAQAPAPIAPQAGGMPQPAPAPQGTGTPGGVGDQVTEKPYDAKAPLMASPMGPMGPSPTARSTNAAPASPDGGLMSAIVARQGAQPAAPVAPVAQAPMQYEDKRKQMENERLKSQAAMSGAMPQPMAQPAQMGPQAMAPAPMGQPMAPTGAAPAVGGLGDDEGPSTSKFASPMTKTKQTSKMLGQPRSSSQGTDDFFSSF